jgi:hypothetical protein
VVEEPLDSMNRRHQSPSRDGASASPESISLVLDGRSTFC